MKFFHLPLLFALSGMTFLATAQDEANFEAARDGIEGLKAPPFGATEWIQLPEGKERLEINEFAGKFVVMLFFQSTCEASMKRAFPTMKKLVEKFGSEDGVEFLAIQTPFEDFTDNTMSKLEGIAEEFNLDIPFGHLAKTKGFYSLNDAYDTGGTPWWVVVNREGTVEYNGHYLNPEETEKNLENLLAGKPID